MKSKSRKLAMLGAAAAALSLGVLTLSATADESCEPQWHPEIGQPGIDAIVRALGVYNGNVIAGGDFITAGGQTVNRIARWDGKEWHPFTSGGQIGVDSPDIGTIGVSALTVYNGDVIAGGTFWTAGGQTMSRIARWDGEEWHPLTSGGQIGLGCCFVKALTVYNGDLIVGGGFTTAGGQTVNRIARWDGEEWHPFTSGGQNGVDDNFGTTVEALTVYKGDLIVGGTFSTAGGHTVYNIARWDGEEWHPFTSGGQIGVDSEVRALTVYNGDLFAGGFFTTAGGQTVNLIARWDGEQWHPLTSGGQTGVNLWIYAFAVYDGDLIAGGTLTTAGGQTVNRIARWDGEEWHPLTSGGQIGVGGGSVFDLAVDNGELTAAGHLTSAGGEEALRIATWVTPEPDGPADLNCNGVVNVSDLLLMVAQWGPCADCDNCPADLDANCTVDVADLLILLSNWG